MTLFRLMEHVTVCYDCHVCDCVVRFNQVQLWVVTEVCLCGQLSKRVQLLKKFIKIAAQ